MKWYWKLLKALGSPWVTAIFGILGYLVIGAFLSTMVGRGETTWLVLYPILILFVCFCTCIVMLIDIIYFFYRHKCRIYQLWKEDTMYYRMEMYCIGLFVCFPLFTVSTILRNTQQILAGIIFNTFAVWSVYFMQVFFPLMLTAMGYIRLKCAKRVKQDVLKNILVTQIFMTYSLNSLNLSLVSRI
jgi:hypothetical protein